MYAQDVGEVGRVFMALRTDYNMHTYVRTYIHTYKIEKTHMLRSKDSGDSTARSLT